DALAEQAVLLGLEGAVIDGFGLLDLAEAGRVDLVAEPAKLKVGEVFGLTPLAARPAPNLVGRGQRDAADRVGFVNPIGLGAFRAATAGRGGGGKLVPERTLGIGSCHCVEPLSRATRCRVRRRVGVGRTSLELIGCKADAGAAPE